MTARYRCARFLVPAIAGRQKKAGGKINLGKKCFEAVEYLGRPASDQVINSLKNTKLITIDLVIE